MHAHVLFSCPGFVCFVSLYYLQNDNRLAPLACTSEPCNVINNRVMPYQFEKLGAAAASGLLTLAGEAL